MCTNVIVHGKLVTTVQQLANALCTTPRKLVWEDGIDPAWSKFCGYSYCLCCVDVLKTAEKFGYKTDNEVENFFGSIVFWKEPNVGEELSNYYLAITET